MERYMGPTQNKDLNQYLKKLTDAGWELESRGRHIKLFFPDSGWPFVMVPKSPSDMRSINNLKAKVRQAMKKVFETRPEGVTA